MYKILRAEELTANIFLMDVEAKRVADSCMPQGCRRRENSADNL